MSDITAIDYVSMDLMQYDAETDKATHYLPSSIASQIYYNYKDPENEESPSTKMTTQEAIDKIFLQLSYLKTESSSDVITEEELASIIKQAEDQVNYELTGQTPTT